MKLDGSYSFDAPRDIVWDILQDPVALRNCIPGVETFEQTGPDEYSATIRMGVASIKGTYTSKIRVFDQERPSHYKLAIEAQGKPGFVRGDALVELKEEAPSKTTVLWSGDGTIAGPIATVGQRIMSGVAKMTIDQLWKSMDEQIRTLGRTNPGP